jgi:hypothetical protein
MPYGICQSDEERCGLSYDAHGIRPLHELLRVIAFRNREGGNGNELVPQLERYDSFFSAAISVAIVTSR